MRPLVASVLVVATLLAGIAGAAFAGQGDFDAPAQDRQIVTGTAADVRVEIPVSATLLNRGSAMLIEDLRVDGR